MAHPKFAKWSNVPLPGDHDVYSAQPCTPLLGDAYYMNGYTHTPYTVLNTTPLPLPAAAFANPWTVNTPLFGLTSYALPVTHVQLPAALEQGSPIKIHSLLSRPPHGPSPTDLQWDITQPPSTARWLTQRNVVVPASSCYSKEAIYPHTFTSLYIALTPDLDHIRKILVGGRVDNDTEADAIRVVSDEGKTISVGDILDAIYTFFQRPLTKRQYRELVKMGGLGVTEQTFLDVANDRISRCLRHTSERERLEGYKTADFLGERWMFQKLDVKYGKQGTWWLELGLRTA